MSKDTAGERKSRKLKFFSLIVVLVLLISYISVVIIRPIKPIYATSLPSPISTVGSLSVKWPSSGQSAVGVLGFGSLVSNGPQTPSPTASIAKVITSLAVLQKYPLSIGQQGPLITITSSDVADYNTFVAENGSVVKVVEGEQISEYQALQAMLLPSANNMANTLAVWAFGSIPNYLTYANQMVKTLRLSSTIVADASGFSPSTVSTSNDLVKLGEAALNNPVIAEIVNQPTAVLPVVGTVNNVDWFIGQYNLIGIKTGNTDQAGGCFLSAARYDLDGGNSITVIGAVMKAPNLQAALDETIPMLESVKNQIQLKSIPAGTAVSAYNLPWGGTINAVTKNDLEAPYLPQMPVSYSSSAMSIAPVQNAGKVVGTVKFGVGSENNTTISILGEKLTEPSYIWKIFHPKYII